MIKLFSLKQEKEKEAAAEASGTKKVAPGLIRMQKGKLLNFREILRCCGCQLTPALCLSRADVSELKTNEKGIEVVFPDKDDIMGFKIKISPYDGFYKDGCFIFDCKVPKTYPHDPPKVLCETTVYHPNIDMEGHVCLNILREDWKPVLTINSIIMGLQFLMLEPNADDPLNKTAAKQMADSPAEFEMTVRKTMMGRTVVVDGKQYSFQKFRDR